MEDFVVITFKTKIVKLTFKEFEDEIDMDQITSIDHSNIYAEILTTPTLMNRIGIWKADAENVYAQDKAELQFKIDELSIKTRKTMKTVQNSKGESVKKYKTNDEVDSEVNVDKGIQIMRSNLLNKRRDADYLDSIYWSIKAKQTSLDSIGEKMPLTPEDFEREITEKVWNGILIQASKRTAGGN